MITNNIVMWETLQNNADWDCFKTPILREILRTQNLLLEEHCAFLEVIHLFQLDVQETNCCFAQRSTESEIISFDAGLRMDGIPALHLWDLIVTVLHGNTHQNDQVRGDLYKFPTRKKIDGKIDDLNNVDFVSSKVEFFSSGSYVVHF